MRRFSSDLFAYLVAVLLAFGTLSLGATAQDTGGSFGGSDFGGGGGGGSDYGGGGGSDYGGGGGSDYGGGGSFGGSSDYGGSSYGGSTYSGGSGDADGGACCCIAIIILGLFVLITVSAVLNKGRSLANAVNRAGSPHVGGPVGDVSAIRIALDHNARPGLQAKLERLARGGAGGTAAGRATALHEVCIELRRNQTSWLFAHVENSPLGSIPTIQAKYQQVAQDARSRFRVETVRAEHAVVTVENDTKMRDRGEGPGIVVVTVLVAARRELQDIHQPEDARALSQLLVSFGAITAPELMGLEVVWSPSVENDRMTIDEMTRVYPEMRRIRDETLAGRVFCGYCRSPFGHELSRCPHCGAATTDARPASASRPGAPT